VSTLAQAVRDYFAAARPQGVMSAYLFGSHVRGTAHAQSDVDVAVVLDYGALPLRGERARAAVSLNSELIAATHCNEVDVVVLNDAPPELAFSIITRGTRLYCSGPEGEAGDHALVRTALLRYADFRPFLERTRRLKLLALSR